MFDLLPENSYSKKSVRWGLITSVLLVGAGAFAVMRHHYDDGAVDVALGIAMLFIWTTRRRELPQDASPIPTRPKKL